MSSLILSHDSHLMMLEIAVENVSEYFLPTNLIVSIYFVLYYIYRIV